MTIQVLRNQAAEHKPMKRKITCVTCNLKRCVGLCRFEAVPPRRHKAA